MHVFIGKYRAGNNIERYAPLLVLVLAVVIVGSIVQVTASSRAARYSRPPVSPLRAVPIQARFSGSPSRITIPDLNINLPIINGAYNTAEHSWSLDFKNAHFADISQLPNTSGGSTFLYGHNTAAIFGRLNELRPSQTVTIETNNGIVFLYTLESVSETAPDDVSFVTYQGPPLLIMQTCSGNWNERRQLFRFKLLRAEIPADLI